MELYEENFRRQKKSKLPAIIVGLIAFLVILTVIIVYLIIYIRSTVLEIKLDGTIISGIEELLYFDESNNNLYLPIRKMAQFFQYNDYNGDYKDKSEDASKCYVQNEYETAMFTLDSNILMKIRIDSDYEYVELDEPVFQKEGDLYTTIDGIKKAYNVEFIYNKEKNKIDIYTMQYLINYYTNYLKIEECSTEFQDQKAIFQSMIIIKQNEKYGVINAENGQLILENKYDKISYLPNTNDFLVKSNGKYGIISSDAEIKIKIAYDEIKIMDNDKKLYVIKENSLYGILNTEGEVILKPEYQQIGLGSNNFSQNGVNSPYILLDDLIPVKNNNKWGIFDLEGNQITEFKFTGLGCTTSKVTNSYPVLVIPSLKLIVVQNEKYYNFITKKGTEVIEGNIIDSVYMKRDTATGENTFYMTFNNQTANVEERLSNL